MDRGGSVVHKQQVDHRRSLSIMFTSALIPSTIRSGDVASRGLQWGPYQARAVVTAVCPGLKFSVGGALHGACSLTVALIQPVHPLLGSGQLGTQEVVIAHCASPTEAQTTATPTRHHTAPALGTKWLCPPLMSEMCLSA